MRLTVFTEPQLGASYEDQLRVALRAQECGYEGFFRSDHYVTMGAYEGLPGPTDSWTTLSALARETSRIRLGTLVTSATFRLPGPLAIAVAQADVMSGGRVELGLGAGWYEREHQAYGITFPSVAERFDRLAEQLEIVTGLWATPVGGRFSFDGTHYRLADSPALPKPVQSPGPTVIVGGRGPRRTPALAARFADEFNVPFASVGDTAQCFERVSRAAEAAGRAAGPDSRPLVFSVAQTVCCGRNDAEVRRRAEAAGYTVDDLRMVGICGTPDEVVERIGEYAKVGATRVHLQFIDLADLDHLDLVAASVAPQLA
jgi:F420-dependent oxidoreductase-like protein